MKEGTLTAGASLAGAQAALVLIHGRGALAADLLPLGGALAPPSVALCAPQASANSWYPRSFLAPLETNQPYLDRSLDRLEETLRSIHEAGIPKYRIALLGFSQGACLVSEYLARTPQRLGAAFILSGGIAGPLGISRSFTGTFEGTPIFLGCSDSDPHVPIERVVETHQTFRDMGGDAELRIYPGMNHQVNEDEIARCKSLLTKMLTDSNSN